MNPDQSSNSFNSISKSIDEQSSSIIASTINPNIAKLSFRVKFETKYGQSLFIIGNIEELGMWEPSKAIPMTTSKDIYPTWKITKEFTCPIGMEISYKYLVKDGNNIYWEELNNNKNMNRHITIQSPGNLIIFDEQSNNISKVKTVGASMNGGTNLSNTTNILNNMLSNLTFETGGAPFINYNNNFLSSNFYSNQSLSSLQKDSIEFSLMKLTEGENEDNNYFNNLSSKDITYEFVDDENIIKNNYNVNSELDPHLEILDLCQNIQQDDKIIIVTTFLPFIIETKENSNNEINLNIPETTNNLNIKYNQTLYDDKLINLILYSIKTMNVCEVYWVGILRGLDEYPEKYQYEICEYLESQKIYAVMPHQKDFINFQIYINKILYPLYNNLEIDINSHFYQNQDNYYMGYLNVNKNFADTIHSCSNDNLRMIFINDIDLAFVPNYLLTKNLGANICLFLHTNFPDYDILTLMQANKEIIKSLLLCNTLGFHSFSHAKNFFNAIKIYFNSTYKVRFDGLFYVEYMNREIPIFIRNPHVEIETVKSFYKNLLLKENNLLNINTNQKVVNLLSFDTVSNVSDILNKLNLVLDLNQTKYLDYKYKLEIVIIKDKYVNKYLIEENDKNQSIINNEIEKIKNKLGQEYSSLFKISFVDFISVKEQIRYFIKSDIFLFTDNNLWNGMRTLMQEFIIVQNEIISNKAISNDIDDIIKNKNNFNINNKENNNEINNKIIGLIAGGNILVPEELKLIQKINFYDLNSFKDTIKKIIEINPEDKIKILNNDCNQIKRNSATIWIKDCLCELKKVMILNKDKIRLKLKIGYGLEFSYYQISKNIKLINQKKILGEYQNSSSKLLLLDLNSIVMLTNCLNAEDTNNDNNNNNDIHNNLNIDNNNNINNISNSNSYIDNNKLVINYLQSLGEDKRNVIYIITNNSKEIFKEIDLNPKNFGFVAENGYIIKPYGEENFKNIINISDNNWKNNIIQLFNSFSRKTGMGKISQKEFSVSWSYKNNENNNSYLLLNELQLLVENIIDKGKFEINLDKNSLEVKIKNNNYNKYHFISEIIQKIINEKKNLDFIFGLNNNDKNGELFFEHLYDMGREFKKNNININLYTTVIGKKSTKANYYFKDITGFIDMLKQFDEQSN